MKRLIVFAACVFAACGRDDDAGDGKIIVTADWLNQSLTVFDHQRLIEGASAENAILKRIDLGGYAPGPLEVEITPDGRSAVVSLSPGFFDGLGAFLIGSPDVPPGGGLLIVELRTGRVTAELTTRHVPMGIAISPDGARAYTANFGQKSAPGSSMSVIDLPLGKVLEEHEVGGGAEQVALSKDGSVGIVSAGPGTIRTFATTDVAGTLSAQLRISDDPGGVAFAGGSRRAVVASSIGPAGYFVIDANDPRAPALTETVELDRGVPFGAGAVPNSERVLVTVGATDPADLLNIDLSGATSTITKQTSNLGIGIRTTPSLPLGAVADGQGYAFVAIPGDGSLAIVDLDTGAERSITWLSEAGPTYAAIGRADDGDAGDPGDSAR